MTFKVLGFIKIQKELELDNQTVHITIIKVLGLIKTSWELEFFK